MACKDICLKYRAFGRVSEGRYAQGQKRCIVCAIFIRWAGTCCPCCGCRLRVKPRSMKLKKKLKEYNQDKIDK